MDALSINTIRGLCLDAVQEAESGHPGTPMDIAPVAYTLWQRFLRFDPADPIWPNRDRFVLSEGHASALLWSLLHLTGVRAVDPDYEVLGRSAVTLEDLKTFRRLDSHAPGHPEYRWTSGVEATTGPLGQGVAMSVGMAMAGQWLAARYNRNGFPIFDFDVYALAGDGCMMEGVSSEAASLAGHQRLTNLCWIYDSNRVTIEGRTDIAFTEDLAARFIAYGWNVATVADANDVDQVAPALHSFKAERERPTLIVVHSHIGYGSPLEGSPRVHGEPLGVEAVKATKRFLGMPEDAEFFIPDGVYDWFAKGVGLAAARMPEPNGRRASRSMRVSIRSWPMRSSACSAGSCRMAGRAYCRRSRPTPRARRRARRPDRCSTRSRRPYRGCWGVRRTSRLRPRPASRPTAPETSNPASAADATSTSGSGSTPRPRSRTAWR